VLPLTPFGTRVSARWDTAAQTAGPALIVLLLALLPDVLRAARLRPTRRGAAGGLVEAKEYSDAGLRTLVWRVRGEASQRLRWRSSRPMKRRSAGVRRAVVSMSRSLKAVA
jgi:hypothetical protein